MYSFYLIPFLIGMFLTVNMGASWTAPSFSTVFGANLIRKNFISGLFGFYVKSSTVNQAIYNCSFSRTSNIFKKIFIIRAVAPIITRTLSYFLTIRADKLDYLTK